MTILDKDKKQPQLASEQAPGLRLALLVSEILNPLFVGLPTLLLIAFHTAPNVGLGLLWWAVTTGGVCAAPFWFIRRGVRSGDFSDHHVSIRQQRFLPLLFSIGCTVATLIVLLLLHASTTLLATLVSVLISGILTLGITHYWKISLHQVGIAGSVTVLSLVFGPLCLLLSPLIALVGWARWRVNAHTVLQVLAGTALAMLVTFGLFRLFGL